MNAYERKASSRAKLISDVNAVETDAEDYLAASIGQTGEKYAAARMKLEKTLDSVRAQVVEGQRALAEKPRAAARATDVYVHDKPWESIAMGASAGHQSARMETL